MNRKYNPHLWKQALLEHYSAPLDKSFRQFRNGAMFFFTGLVIIYCATQALTPSLRQELIVLSGLVILGVGFILAMLAQVRLVISRIVQFFRDDGQ